MEYEIEQDDSELLAFKHINLTLLEFDEVQLGLDTWSWTGKHVLIVNEGGIQNNAGLGLMKGLLKGRFKNYWQNVYKLLPDLPKTATGKFTGKVELHTFEGNLKKIKFIPNIKP